jgi:hypothetical protein
MLRFLPPVLLVIFFLSSCDHLPWAKKDDDVLARVHNKYLYASEIRDMINTGTLPQDSITMVTNYINNWIREQLLLYQAEKSLAPHQKDFSKQLNDYRNSLVIYEYETSIVRQKLDTVVSMLEVQRYYDANRANFELKENIVKVNYVQIENDAEDLPRLRRLWQTGDELSKTELEQYCIQNGLNFSMFDDLWIYFRDLLSEIPITTYNEENILQYNRKIEVRDSLYLYLVEFTDFKLKESIAPLSLVQNNIRKIIINRRKIELLQNLQNEIFDRALLNQSFEIY